MYDFNCFDVLCVFDGGRWDFISFIFVFKVCIFLSFRKINKKYYAFVAASKLLLFVYYSGQISSRVYNSVHTFWSVWSVCGCVWSYLHRHKIRQDTQRILNVLNCLKPWFSAFCENFKEFPPRNSWKVWKFREMLEKLEKWWKFHRILYVNVPLSPLKFVYFAEEYGRVQQNYMNWHCRILKVWNVGCVLAPTEIFHEITLCHRDSNKKRSIIY